MTIGRRWVVAASAILALQNNHSLTYVNAFSPQRVSSLASINYHPSKLFSSAATADEAYETKSPETTKSGKKEVDNNSSKQIIPGEVLHQSHQVVAIKLLLNNEVAQPIKEEEKKEQSPPTAVFSKENMSKKKTNKAQGDDFTGKRVVFENGETGIIVAQRPPIAYCLINHNADDPPTIAVEGETKKVSVHSDMMTISVSESMVGKVLDCFGNVIEDHRLHDNADDNESFCERPIFAPIPQVKDIALINEPLLTGTCMVDALAPIGKGQNMLIIGQEGTGERDIVLDLIKMQLESNELKKTKIVYALASSDPDARKSVLSALKKDDVLKDIIVVSMHDCDIDDPASVSAEAVTVAGTACSIAEAFALSKGEDTLVIVDNINPHKKLWDWSTRVMVDIYGVDAVVRDDMEGGASSEMRGFYSALIQRAGKFKKSLGDGSMTSVMLNLLPRQTFMSDNEDDTVFSAEDFQFSSEKIKQRIDILVSKNIPLTPTNLRKIQIPVPEASDSEKERRLAIQHSEDLISMSDGQIWLDETLYANGQRPALDPARSLTRVGIGADTKSRADAPAFRKLVGGLRFDFAQATAVDGADANSGADKQLLKKEAYLLAMHQESDDRRKLSENCVTLLAATMGSLNSVVEKGSRAGTESGDEAIRNLLKYVKEVAPAAMNEIDVTLDMDEKVRKELEDAIKTHFSS